MRYKITILVPDKTKQHAKLLMVAASINQNVSKLDTNKEIEGHLTVIAHTTAEIAAKLQKDPQINVQLY